MCTLATVSFKRNAYYSLIFLDSSGVNPKLQLKWNTLKLYSLETYRFYIIFQNFENYFSIESRYLSQSFQASYKWILFSRITCIFANSFSNCLATNQVKAWLLKSWLVVYSTTWWRGNLRSPFGATPWHIDSYFLIFLIIMKHLVALLILQLW